MADPRSDAATADRFDVARFFDRATDGAAASEPPPLPTPTPPPKQKKRKDPKPPPPPKKALKVLVLHGWGQDGELGRKVLRRLTEKLRKQNVHLSFATAPHKLPLTSEVEVEGGQKVAVSNFPPDRTNPRAWFLYGDGGGSSGGGGGSNDDDATVPEDFLTAPRPYRGIDASLESLRDEWRQSGPFDGVLGFSQGAAVAHLLAAVAVAEKTEQKKNNTEQEAESLLSTFRSLEFAVFAGGFPSRMASPPVAMGARDAPLLLPTLHFIASDDAYVPPPLQEELKGRFRAPTTHRHDKGHTIPQRAGDTAAMVEFFGGFQ